MTPKNTIKFWAKDDQPREKLINLGPHNLSNSELIGILIHHGTPEKSAVALAKEILKLGSDNLNELGKLGINDLIKVKGIGPAKAVTISAALELGRRRHASHLLELPVINSTQHVATFLQTRLKDLTKEVFAVVYLNQANKVVHFEIVSEGGMTSTIVDPRIIIKKSLEKNAVSIILSHNHPSGNLSPSDADKRMTKKLETAASFFDIKVIDHVIVSEAGYYSFADEGFL